jgi:hypothetical protein
MISDSLESRCKRNTFQPCLGALATMITTQEAFQHSIHPIHLRVSAYMPCIQMLSCPL